MKRIILYILLVFLICSCTKEEVEIRQADCIPFYFSDTYSYPVRPGSDEWKALKSLTEMVEVCQIPEEKLKTISTEGLLETLLNYPLMLDYMAFNKMQNGFNRIKKENNGFSELYSREDIFEVISERYELMSLDCEENIYPPFLIGNTTPIGFAFMTFELFIFQDEFLHNLNKKQKYLIFDLVLKKHEDKNKHNLCNFDKLVSAAILGKIMYENNFSPFVKICNESDYMRLFIEIIPTYRPVNIQPIEIIEEYARYY